MSADVEIGTLAGYLDITDTMSPKMAAAGQALDATGAKFGELEHKAESLGERLSQAMRDPMSALEGLGTSLKDNLVDSLTSFMGVSAIALTALAGLVTAGFELAESQVSVGAALEDMSRKAGVSIEDMGALKFMSQALGSGAEQLSNSMFMMGKRIESGSSAVQEGFEKIGLSWKEIANMKPQDQLLAISDAMRALPEGTNKAGIAFQIFSRQGRELLPQLLEPMRELYEQGTKFNTWTTESAMRAKEFEISMNVLRMEIGRLVSSAGKDLIPVFIHWVEVAKDSEIVMKGIPAAGHAIAEVFKVAAGAAEVLFSGVSTLVSGWQALPTAAKEVTKALAEVAVGMVAINYAFSAFSTATTVGMLTKVMGPLGEMALMIQAFGWSGFVVMLQSWAAPLAAIWSGVVSATTSLVTFGGTMTGVNAVLTMSVGLLGPVAVGIAALSAGLLIANQAWELHKERVEQAALAEDHERTTKQMLAEASRVAGKAITEEGEAHKVLREHILELQGVHAVDSEATKLATLYKDLHKQSTVALTAAVSQYVTAALAAGRSGEEITKSLISQKIAGDEVKGVIGKMAAEYTELTKKHKEQQEAIAEVTLEARGWEAALATIPGATLDAIRVYMAQGVALETLAKAYDLNKAQIKAITALDKEQDDNKKAQLAGQMEAEKLFDELQELQVQHGGTTTEIQLAQIDRWGKAVTAHMQKAKADTAEFYLALEQLTKEKIGNVLLDWDRLNKTSKAYLDDMAHRAEVTYQYAVDHFEQYDERAVNGFLETAVAARKAAEEWGTSFTEAATAVDRVVTATTNHVVLTWEQAISQVRSGLGTMSGQVPYVQAQKAEIQKAYDEHRYYGPVTDSSQLNPRGTGPDWAALGLPRAMGGTVMADEPYIVGERGPELMIPSRGGEVIANNRLSSAPLLGGGGGPVSVVFESGSLIVNWPVMNDMNAMNQLRRMFGDVVMQTLRSTGTIFPARS